MARIYSWLWALDDAQISENAILPRYANMRVLLYVNVSLCTLVTIVLLQQSCFIKQISKAEVSFVCSVVLDVGDFVHKQSVESQASNQEHGEKYDEQKLAGGEQKKFLVHSR